MRAVMLREYAILQAMRSDLPNKRAVKSDTVAHSEIRRKRLVAILMR